MRARGDRLRFALDPGEPIGIGGDTSGSTLIATSRLSPGSGARHLAHAAGADGRDDFVLTEARPRRK